MQILIVISHFIILIVYFDYRYQFNPMFFQTSVTAQILLKALTNLPHTDFTLCKCLIDAVRVSHHSLELVFFGGNLVCNFFTNSMNKLEEWCQKGNAHTGADLIPVPGGGGVHVTISSLGDMISRFSKNPKYELRYYIYFLSRRFNLKHIIYKYCISYLLFLKFFLIHKCNMRLKSVW